MAVGHLSDDHLVRLTSRQYQLLWISVGLSAAGYLGFALWSGWREVWHAIQAIGAKTIVLALGLSFINYLLRAERWHLYMHRSGHDLPRLINLHIYFSGFALTTTPGKAGELIRSVFLKPYGVFYHQSAAMFFSERLADLVTIVGLTALGLTHLPAGRIYFLVLVSLLFIGVLILRTKLPEKLLLAIAGPRQSLLWLADVAASSRPFWRGRMVWQVLALSLVAWLAEGMGAWLILHALMPNISISYALFVYGFAMLVGALSFLPGGLGGTEATMTGLLVLQGLPLPAAIAATVIVRLVTLWFAVLLGVFGVLSLPTPTASGQSVNTTAEDGIS